LLADTAGSAATGAWASGRHGEPTERGNGEPPSLIHPPAGCRFHPRCPMAMPRCTTDLPVRLEIGDRPGHWAACWLFDRATVTAERPGSAAAAGIVREEAG
ncbi:MAG TPA: oligopeptide/dipeptide ABC transporter ATP-binding protein, partial [Pseudonocardiaceae bacterium]|nr:oligopeptide/dipeptide ABC transporter ATP-binding protein [Pseudonocardiaceae bacterium]